MTSRPVIPFIQDYIRSHASDIIDIADKLTVPATAIAAAVAEEASRVYSESIFAPGFADGTTKNLTDAVLDGIVLDWRLFRKLCRQGRQARGINLGARGFPR